VIIIETAALDFFLHPFFERAQAVIWRKGAINLAVMASDINKRTGLAALLRRSRFLAHEAWIFLRLALPGRVDWSTEP